MSNVITFNPHDFSDGERSIPIVSTKSKRGRPACPIRVEAREAAKLAGETTFTVPEGGRGCTKCGGRVIAVSNNTCINCRNVRHQPKYRATELGQANAKRSSAAQWERLKTRRD